MNTLSKLNWPLVLGLGAVALIRPLVSMIGTSMGISDPPAVPIVLTVIITVVWIAVVGLSRVRHPFLTLVLTGVAYGVFAIILAAVASPILDGRMQGPLVSPIATIAVLVTNALWGAAAGLLALLLQRIRGVRTV